MLKTIKKIYNLITALLIIAVMALLVLLVGVRALGYQPYTVLSGSMEPKFHVGSVIYVEKVDPRELQVGDPLTYTLDGTVITHEIVEIIEADNVYDMQFVTQGLTNNVTDGNIPVSSIIGRPKYTIPYLGYVAAYLQNSTAIMGIVCVVIVLLLISVLLDFLTAEKKKPDESSVLPDHTADPDGDPENNIKQEDSNKEEKQ